MAWVREQCNLDDAKYFGLLDEEPQDIAHCKYCHVPVATEQELEKTEERVPAVAKKDVPRSMVLIPRKLMAALLAIAILAPFLVGSASGVVLSPDDERGGSLGERPTPTPAESCDPMTLAGCGDLVIIIEKLIDEQLLDHLTIDHAPSPTPGGSPSPASSVTPTPSPTSAQNGNGTRTTPTERPRASAAPTARPRPTAPPATPRPTPTTPAPTAGPSSSPCFRPGAPQSGKDPCGWPVDDK